VRYYETPKPNGESMKRWHHSVVICLCAALFTACASRPAVVPLTTRPALDPTQVNIYLTAPQDYEIVGIVETTSQSGWMEQSAVDNAINELKNQAAKIGANGVLLSTAGEDIIIAVSGSDRLGAIPVTGNTLSGKAIIVGE